MRLDHLITKRTNLSEKTAKRAIAEGKVLIAGVQETNPTQQVDRFSEVRYNSEVIQAENPPVYIMLHKPIGYLSATSDDQHPVALDLIDHPAKPHLHIAGRLDRSSSGLLLLTNDSEWSRRLTDLESKVDKIYLVETQQPIPADAVEKFAAGFFFTPENTLTKPAQLQILDNHLARITISEGKYHQIKRMFHKLEPAIRLKALHREAIGEYVLPEGLEVGGWGLLNVVS